MQKGIQTYLRPDYHEWFPNFTESELTTRIKYLPIEKATLLTLNNLTKLIKIDSKYKLFIHQFLDQTFVEQRTRMVEMLEYVGISHETCASLMSVSRETFAPPTTKLFSYLNTYLPWNETSCVSPPGTVALMIDRFRPYSKTVIELGVGSGYHACCLVRRKGKPNEVIGYEANTIFAQFGAECVSSAGISDQVKIIPHALNSEILTEIKANGIYTTAAGNNDDIIKRLQTGCQIQLVRPIGELEYSSEKSDSWLKRRWHDHQEYSKEWNTNYGCISTGQKHNGEILWFDHIYDVSFVPTTRKTKSVPQTYKTMWHQLTHDLVS